METATSMLATQAKKTMRSFRGIGAATLSSTLRGRSVEVSKGGGRKVSNSAVFQKYTVELLSSNPKNWAFHRFSGCSITVQMHAEKMKSCPFEGSTLTFRGSVLLKATIKQLVEHDMDFLKGVKEGVRKEIVDGSSETERVRPAERPHTHTSGPELSHTHVRTKEEWDVNRGGKSSF